jgi:hypothetical protein
MECVQRLFLTRVQREKINEPRQVREIFGSMAIWATGTHEDCRAASGISFFALAP